MEDATSNFIAEAIAGLDLDTLAAASNLITGGTLRADDARKVACLVADTAIRSPGKEVIVAGIRAIATRETLILGISGDVEKLEL